MAKPSFIDEKARISAAALRLADAKGWRAVTIDAVAKAAKIKPALLKQHFAAPHELAAVIATEIDHEAFAGAGKMSGGAHDVLFDLLMARFDILQKHRKAILSMADAARQDRALSFALARATLDGAYRLIAAARKNVKIEQPSRPILALGTMAIYSAGFFVWRKDDSRDLAKTMAALDRALRLAGKAVTLLTRGA